MTPNEDFGGTLRVRFLKLIDDSWYCVGKEGVTEIELMKGESGTLIRWIRVRAGTAVLADVPADAVVKIEYACP